MLHHCRLIIGSILVLMSSPTWAHSLTQYQHHNLMTNNIEQLTLMPNKPSIMMLFEPDCSWCFKQAKVLNQLHATCPNQVNIIALGVNGDKQALKQQSWKMKLHFPAYMTSHDLLDVLGEIPATPMSLLSSSEGNYIGHLRGYVKLAPLKALLSTQLNISCS